MPFRAEETRDPAYLRPLLAAASEGETQDPRPSTGHPAPLELFLGKDDEEAGPRDFREVLSPASEEDPITGQPAPVGLLLSKVDEEAGSRML